MKNLSNQELNTLTGGESGWYYLGKAAKFVCDTASDFADWVGSGSANGSANVGTYPGLGY
jgi:hypothetical protein